MTTTDSGTETLFSDDSPCDHICSPSVCSGEDTEVPLDDSQSVNSRLAPPNIQPYSGVLEKVSYPFLSILKCSRVIVYISVCFCFIF